MPLLAPVMTVTLFDMCSLALRYTRRAVQCSDICSIEAPTAKESQNMMKATRGIALSQSTAILALVVLATTLQAQDRLRSMPGFEHYQRMAPLIRTAVAPSLLSLGSGVTWSADGRSFEYD